MQLHLKNCNYLRRGAHLSGGATLNSRIKEEDGRNCSDAADSTFSDGKSNTSAELKPSEKGREGGGFTVQPVFRIHVRASGLQQPWLFCLVP